MSPEPDAIEVEVTGTVIDVCDWAMSVTTGGQVVFVHACPCQEWQVDQPVERDAGGRSELALCFPCFDEAIDAVEDHRDVCSTLDVLAGLAGHPPRTY